MASGSIILSLEKVTRQKGVVILPIQEYERMKEDLEMAQSKKLPKNIARARQEALKGKLIALAEIRKRLHI